MGSCKGKEGSQIDKRNIVTGYESYYMTQVRSDIEGTIHAT